MNHVRIFNTLPDSPKVAVLARLWGCGFDEALGCMVRWLCWLDKHTQDGKTGLQVRELDRLVFGKAKRVAGLVELGWAKLAADGEVQSVDFEQYNGPTAKQRAMEAARKRTQRAKKNNERR